MESAIEQLKNMTSWDSEPALTEAELGEILERSSLVDEVGFIPTDSLWTPTYDLNAAAAAAWLIKAARSAGTTEIDADTAGVTSKIFDNYRSLAQYYAGRRNISVPIRVIDE